MSSIGALVALFAAGYLLGVWTACLVLRRRQDDDEDSPGRRIKANLSDDSP